MVTRTIINDGDPLVSPDGDPIAAAVYSFTLVDEAKRQATAVFDSAEGGGEHIRGDVQTATTNEVGLFTVDLWPNDRGEVATLYKVALTGVIKPFYIRVASGEGDLTLIAAKTAYEATSPQTLSLFDALLAQILAQVAAFSEVVTTAVNGLMSSGDKVKLDGIAENANNYTHPANHAPAIITQDASNRFVTDAEKTTWNAKASTAAATTAANGLMAAADKTKLDTFVAKTHAGAVYQSGPSIAYTGTGGFTCVRNSTGVHTVTFDMSYTLIISTSSSLTNGYTAISSGNDTTSFQVKTYNAAGDLTNADFSFIAATT
jgi:hypothetical protein